MLRKIENQPDLPVGCDQNATNRLIALGSLCQNLSQAHSSLAFGSAYEKITANFFWVLLKTLLPDALLEFAASLVGAPIPLWMATALNLGFIGVSVSAGGRIVEINRAAFTTYEGKLQELNPMARWLHDKRIISIPRFAVLMHYFSTACLLICGIILPLFLLGGGTVPFFLVLAFLSFMLLRVYNLVNDDHQVTRAAAERI